MSESEGKYGQYLFKNPIVQGKFCNRMIFYSAQHEPVKEKDFSVLWNCITEPYLMVADAHSHDFDQFLHFYGANSLNITEFDAEIEMSLGPDGEKHIIREPTILHIPAGTLHCPLNFKVVKKPVIFMNVAMTPQYVQHKPATSGSH
jgi:hypothetical protein